MSLKSYKLILGLLVLFSCSNNKNNFILIQTDSVDGKIASRRFVDSIDRKYTMQEYYWDNGKVMARAFRYNELKDGKWEFFSPSGKLVSIKIYREDKFINKVDYDTLK